MTQRIGGGGVIRPLVTPITGSSFTYLGTSGGNFSGGLPESWTFTSNFTLPANTLFILVACTQNQDGYSATLNIGGGAQTMNKDVDNTVSNEIMIFSLHLAGASTSQTFVLTGTSQFGFAVDVFCFAISNPSSGVVKQTASGTAAGITIPVSGGDYLFSTYGHFDTTANWNGSTQAPTANLSGTTFSMAYWNTITLTNASFSVSVSPGSGEGFIAATYH